jgi:glycosyltransferase involved in cell wall biosynthesis
MRQQGHDVVVVPMYLPLPGTMKDAAGETPIFFGGVNVYLQTKWGFFRKTPRWVDWFFDRPGLLRWVGRKAGMTSAKELGETTVSMCQGLQGRLAKELNRLVEWLGRRENRPDVVCLSNVMLAPLAGAIKSKLAVAVVCVLQDEEGFLDALVEPYRGQAWEMLRKHARNIDGFIAVSEYYAKAMRTRLGLGEGRIDVVHIGIDLDDFASVMSNAAVPTVGFLSQMCFSKGLDTLAEAFIRIKKSDALKNSKLVIAGGLRSGDEALIEEVRGKLASNGVLDDVEFMEGFDAEARREFFRKVSVVCVPEKEAAAYSLYALEALAAGVPFVEPASGVFPELLEMTAGGVLYKPNDAAALADALAKVLGNDAYRRELGERGRKAVFEKFDVKQTAEAFLRIYRERCEQFGRGR